MFELTRRRLLGALSAGFAGACSRSPIELFGSGATLPAQQYAAWLAAYAAEVPQVRIAYLPIGSGGGIRQLAHGTVDFGASDVEIDSRERALLARKVVSLPTAIIAVGICYHLAGALALRLSRRVCAAIYLGEITSWQDAAIAAENPGTKLPNLPIVPVFRADGGGTTALFTSRLASSNSALRERVGVGRGARFLVGIGARGSDGVVDLVANIPGAIGYVEVVHALRAGLPVALLDDGHGGFVAPTRAAVLGACLAHEPVARGYPLSSPTYLVVPQKWKDAAKGAAMARFSYWVVTAGQASLEGGESEELASSLLPLPAPLADFARAELGRLTSGDTNLLAMD